MFNETALLCNTNKSICVYVGWVSKLKSGKKIFFLVGNSIENFASIDLPCAAITTQRDTLTLLVTIELLQQQKEFLWTKLTHSESADEILLVSLIASQIQFYSFSVFICSPTLFRRDQMQLRLGKMVR